MSSCPHALQSFSLPRLSAPIYKEECTLCFEGQDDRKGVYVCLSCFNGACLNHSSLHASKTGHPLVLNIKRSPVQKNEEERPQKITKVAIGKPGGAFDAPEEYNFETLVYCLQCRTEVDATLGQLTAVIEAIMTAPSAAKQDELKSWENEVTDCPHTRDLRQVEGAPQLAAKALAHCGNCDLHSNLWLCLSCGYLGCGRKNYDGSGGNNHAVEHFQSSGHPVVCKLGTITPEGTADIYCYTCDDSRLDPHLAKHLQYFGINVSTVEKTEKSTAEIELDRNLSLNFNETTEDGQKLVPLFGPAFTGLKNLGNSCYMASVLQCVFALPTFSKRYTALFEQHPTQCREQPAACFHCQMGKLADGLLSGRFSRAKSTSAASDTADSSQGQEGIAPRMFKALIGKDHPEFSTMRQQDAYEFFQHLMKVTQQKEFAQGVDPTAVFEFSLQQRLQCTHCKKVRYSPAKTSEISIPIPTKVTDVDTPPPLVPLADCLKEFAADEAIEFHCPSCKQQTVASKNQRFETFPDVLVMHARRFVYADWVPRKLNVLLDVPDVVDLTPYEGHGLQAGETILPEASVSAAPAPAMLPEHQVDPSAVDQLTAMGFGRNAAVIALRATNNQGAEAAMNWIFERLDDPSLNDPLPSESGAAPQASAGGPAVSEESIAMLADMGFTNAQAKKALKNTDNNMERAVEWLFSHPDDTGEDRPAAASSSPAAVAAGRPADAAHPPKYRLVGFITHKGPSVHCGHYVAHIRRPEDGQWVLFNDAKVALAPNPPIGHGYLYFFSRVGV